MTRKTIRTGAAAVVLLGAVIIANAGPANADTNDDQFIDALGAVYGIEVGSQRAGAIANAHESCQSLEAGQSEASVEAMISFEAPHMSADAVHKLLRAEELYYCMDFYK